MNARNFAQFPGEFACFTLDALPFRRFLFFHSHPAPSVAFAVYGQSYNLNAIRVGI